MNNQTLENHPYIQEILRKEAEFKDRKEFHNSVKETLLQMGQDRDFLLLVVKRNFDDIGYLTQVWTLFNIPYLHIYESDDFILKIHLFPGSEKYIPGIAAHAIHHHNNYLLTTNAFFGSGYGSLLFEKEVKIDARTKATELRISKQFHQKDWNPSFVDAWEPHVVFLPETLSATLIMWTPDKKRTTDSLRNVGLLKAIKNPLRKIIQKLSLESAFGIAKADTYQFYPSPDGVGFIAIEEEEYFAPTKAAKGELINDYCMQILFSFLLRCNVIDEKYLAEVSNRSDTPQHFKKWIEIVLQDAQVPEVYHRTEINIPQGTYNLENIERAIEMQKNL